MSDPVSYPQPLGPLNAGNVVSAALKLYRDRFKAYFKVSLIAGLWSICPLAVFVLFILINSLLLTHANSAFIFLFIFFNIIIAVFVFVYCSAKYFINLAIISRLAFFELINCPESIRQARQQLHPKMFLLWRVNIMAGLLLFLINLGLSLSQQLLFELPANLGSGVISALWKLIGNLIYLVFYIWFYSRFFIFEVPLSIENNLTAINSIERSWLLTEKSPWRISLVLSVAFLITIPFYFLIFIPIILSVAQFYYSLFKSIEAGLFSPFLLINILLLFLSIIIIFILINILVTPFWQVVKSVIYYDLRTRQEGLGIELRQS